ncbi:LTA synthase family protein [Orrella sp. JC864]|uniref:LTA synthase family protein n=1 Tax=Orrella sp. JC864 TaxID=3120298 RepID=UPI00300B08F6
MRTLTLRFLAAGLLLLCASRLALVIWQWPRVEAVQGLWPVMLGGLRIDVTMLCMIAVLPAVLSPWLGHLALPTRLAAWWFRLGWMLLVLLEVSTPQFIVEYDTRPNRLYIEYLTSPREVSSMLWEGYKGVLLAALLALLAAAWLAGRLFPTQVRQARLRLAWRPLLSLAVLAAMVLGIRGTLAHRPINPSTVAFGSDAMVNTLALNSLYGVCDALYRLQDERAARVNYGKLAPGEALAVVREAAGLHGAPLDPQIPTLHAQHATVRRERPLNLVIVLQESLGAQYVGSLGGAGLTPELDALSRQGWSFTRAYATGTRSVRGLEAVTTGFLPTPAEAVLKLPRAQAGFFTLAELLGRQGYVSRFVYGGEAHFDNMRGFFLGNGFNQVIDRKRFGKTVFTGSWGASDEDMFRELDALLMADRDPQQDKGSGGRPTFTLAFTVSNHSPYEYPAGRIAPQGDPATAHNAVRYADWAMGRFFAQARQRPYWQDTLFLVVADHDSRVFGASLVPVRHFQIPAVILGADVAPRRDDRLISQIDLAPTLLSLMGVDSVHPMPGHDLTRQAAGRAIMQYGNNYGYLTESGQLVVLEPDKPARQYRYSAPQDYVAQPPDPALVRQALGHALWPVQAYREQQYRLPALAPARPAALAGAPAAAPPR